MFGLVAFFVVVVMRSVQMIKVQCPQEIGLLRDLQPATPHVFLSALVGGVS